MKTWDAYGWGRFAGQIGAVFIPGTSLLKAVRVTGKSISLATRVTSDTTRVAGHVNLKNISGIITKTKLDKTQSGRTFYFEGNIPVDGTGYTHSNLKLGREVHEKYKINSANGVTKFKEFILPSGKRVDYIDFESKTIFELKPYNPRQIKDGEKQLQGYLKEVESVYGGKWNVVLDTY